MNRVSPSRRVTQENIASILNDWPQAISADDGDLRVLHDMANAGAGEWGETLFWPDYLWLALDRPASPVGPDDVQQMRVHIRSPIPSELDAKFGEVNTCLIRPDSGRFPLSERIECLIEVKAIYVDHVPKLRRFKPDVPWPAFLGTKLRHIFGKRLAHADQQIRDGRRLLGLGEARGVSIVVNEGSPSLAPEMVHAFLASEIHRFQHTNAIVYLADRPERPNYAVIVVKDNEDTVLQRFADEFLMMLTNVEWVSDRPTIKGGPYPRLGVRIEMDERSRAMCRTWSTGWRVVDDATPVPAPTLKMQLVYADEFRSGLC
jgi:hypothetical protein